MTTNKIDKKTKEGLAVWAKTENNEVYHYVPRDERITWYAKEVEGIITVEDISYKGGLVTVKATLPIKSDFTQGVGSCRLTNPNTEDPAGLAYKKAIDNALQAIGVGMILEDGQPISSLNRGVTPEEAVNAAFSQLP